MKKIFSVNCYTQEKGLVELERPEPVASKGVVSYLKDCVRHHLGENYNLSQVELDDFRRAGATTIRYENVYYTFSWE